MKFSTKHGVMAAALIATTVAAYFSPDPGSGEGVALSDRALRVAAPQPAAASERSSLAPRGRVSKTEAPDVLEIRARPAVGADGVSPVHAFTSQSWTVPAPAKKAKPAVVEAVAPPAPPTAPPLPFKVLGRYEEDGGVVVFLQYRDTNLVVRLGDTIAEHYKVEGLQGHVLTLRHLPTDQTQTLDVGGAS